MELERPGDPREDDLLSDLGPEWWDDDEYALRSYVGPTPSEELIASVQKELGYRLPSSYVALMRRHNGGVPKRTCVPVAAPTTWASDHVMLTGIFGIGRDLDLSLGGGLGSRFWIEDGWGYPDLGVYFADCPSAGHDLIAMDYREVGPEGEPRIVHVDQGDDYAVTVLAPNFAAFVRGLRDEEEYLV